MSLWEKSDEPQPVARGRKVWAASLRENQIVDEVFLVLSRALRQTRAGSPFLALELGDRTGRVEARVWDDAEAAAEEARVDHFVRVSGRVELYGDSLQLKAAGIKAVPEEEVEPGDFLPATGRSVGEMEEELRALAAGISSAPLRALVESFLGDPDFIALFRQAPAAKAMHHAALGGLLEHTLSVAKLCLAVARHYPTLDADLLLTAALLHDVGKTRELIWARRFDYSDEGRLVGHLVIGAEMVLERAGGLPGFPEETLLLLRHAILSHHGQHEWGSPKLPMTAEALVLHYVDDLDSKVNAVKTFMNGKDGHDPGSRWTAFHRVLDRYLYKGTGGRGRSETGEG